MDHLLHEYIPQIVGQVEQQGTVHVWRLPSHLSQSKLGDRPNSSNACTLIVLKLAEAIHVHRILFSPVGIRVASEKRKAAGGNTISYQTDYKSQSSITKERNSGGFSPSKFKAIKMSKAENSKRTVCVSQLLIGALVNAIVDGNETHERAMKKRQSTEQKFTIPDAINECDFVFKEIDYTTVHGPIFTHLAPSIRGAIRYLHKEDQLELKHLFLLLIAHHRSVLLIYQPDQQLIGMIDSHSHGRAGALMAICSIRNLDIYCQWIAQHVFPESFHIKSEEFELSAICYKGTKMDNINCSSPEMKGHIFKSQVSKRILSRSPSRNASYKVLKQSR